MSEMVERAGQRLKEWFVSQDGPSILVIDMGSYVTLDGSFDPSEITRIVIEAIREPTSAMCNAQVMDSYGRGLESIAEPGTREDQTPASIWRAMIDEALRDE
jgi:hypothetical protein